MAKHINTFLNDFPVNGSSPAFILIEYPVPYVLPFSSMNTGLNIVNIIIRSLATSHLSYNTSISLMLTGLKANIYLTLMRDGV